MTAADNVPSFPLDVLPPDAELLSVDAAVVPLGGRDVLRVSLTSEAANGEPGVDYIDQPTFVVFPVEFRSGRIDVEISSGLREDAPDYARGFAGIAYRISTDARRFESVYVRPTNGRRLDPPASRDERAIQYFSYPDWPYQRLRDEFPDGGFEAGADILPLEWLSLSVEIQDARVVASVNGETVLDIADTMTAPSSGRVGLWVDIGTEAFFSNLVITYADWLTAPNARIRAVGSAQMRQPYSSSGRCAGGG